jgi:cytochrome c oxidase cbb3-type subunit IV
MIMGVITALLIVIFCGIVGWAYSSRRKQEFELMARLPLADDPSENQP